MVHDTVIVMNKSRTCKTSELYQVTNTLIVSPQPTPPDNFDKAWVYMPVPNMKQVIGSWAWFLQWCTAYDERLVPMTVTGSIWVPNKPR